MLLLSLLLVAAAGAPPTVEITTLDASGPAPFTAHVHAVESRPAAGTLLTARLRWRFGDVGAPFDELHGFNAAHVYEAPGTYTVTLEMTDEAGTVTATSVEIVVTPPARRPIFVGPRGSDGNDGGTAARAVRSVGRAVQLLGHDTEIRLERGAVYPVTKTITVPWRNVVIGAWGEGPPPELRFAAAGRTTEAIIRATATAEDVVIEGIRFDSPAPSSNQIVRGVVVEGRNVTVRRCTFGRVSYAIRAVGAPRGVMTVGNTAGELGAYFVYGEGHDHCHLGNTVAGSTDEHNMRFYAERVQIAHNALTNHSKRTIWCVDGGYASIVRNRLVAGPLMLGPKPEDPGAWRWTLIEGNVVLDGGVVFRHGTGHVLAHSNVVRRHGDLAFDVWGRSDRYDRTCIDVAVVNNTVINHHPRGRCVALGSETVGVVVANNMYVAPSLETGSYMTSNAFVLGSELGSATFSTNLWAEPAAVGWGDGWHYLWPYWSDEEGYRDPAEWRNLPQTSGEMYRAYAPDDVDGAYVPQFDAAVGQAMPGVHVDLHGNPRPRSGPVTVGAVE